VVLEYYAEDVNQRRSTAQRMHKEVEETEKVIQTLQEEINTLNESISKKEKTEKDIKKASDEVKDSLNQITQLTVIRDQIQLECQSIQSTLKEELDEDLEELKRVNENFSDEVQAMQLKRQELERGRMDLQKEKADVEKIGNKFAEEYGKYRTSIEQLDMWKKDRDNLIVNIATSYQINEYTEGPFDDACVEKFLEITNELSKKAQDSLGSIQEEHRKIDHEKGQKIESVRREYKTWWTK